MTFVLDTHVLLERFTRGKTVKPAHLDVIEAATSADPVVLSDISLWEIATLHSLGRVRLHLPLRDWLDVVTLRPTIRRLRISPAVATEVAALPDTFHRDPADRIIVASARVLGATVLTRDQRIIDSGLVVTA